MSDTKVEEKHDDNPIAFVFGMLFGGGKEQKDSDASTDACSSEGEPGPVAEVRIPSSEDMSASKDTPASVSVMKMKKSGASAGADVRRSSP